MAKRSGISVDFTGVESGGRAIPDDDYLLEVVSCEEKESGDGNPYLAWKWKVVEGSVKGATLYDNTSLQPQALWRLKMAMECMGMDVNSGKMSISPESFKGKRAFCSVGNEKYQGKDKPRITAFLGNASMAGGGESTSSPGITLKKGTKVSFDFEGEKMEGIITGLENGKVVVTTNINGTKEEWELTSAEVTPL